MEIDMFTKLNQKYGLIFGDLLLERLAKIIRKQCEINGINDAVFVRGNAGRILIWLPQKSETDTRKIMQSVRKHFEKIVHKDYQMLSLKSGMACVKKEDDVWEVVKRAKYALLTAQKNQIKDVCYEKLPETEQSVPEDIQIEERPPFEKLKQMSLSSLALNLFDRSSDMKVALDILALKLREICHLNNVVITKFNKEYLVNSLSYEWKKDRETKWDGIVHCNATQYTHFIETKIKQKILPVTPKERQEVLLKEFIPNEDSLFFHMTDDGEYSGTILFTGVDRQFLE